MKTCKLGLLIAIPLVCFGCEEGGDTAGEAEAAAAEGAGGAGEAEAAKAAGGAGGEAAEPAGPDAACTTLVAAIKAKSVEDVVAASGEGAAEAVTAESIETLATALGEGTCGEPAVEGDAATVPVTVGEETKDLKFTKAGDAWQFDAAAWLEANAAAAPKGKAKGKGKGKGKGKKRRRRGK